MRLKNRLRGCYSRCVAFGRAMKTTCSIVGKKFQIFLSAANTRKQGRSSSHHHADFFFEGERGRGSRGMCLHRIA